MGRKTLLIADELELMPGNDTVRAGADRLLRGEDTLEAPELLPGFSVRVGEFFETDS